MLRICLDNVEACAKAGIEPVIAMGRQPHHPPLAERLAPEPPVPDDPGLPDPGALAKMTQRLKTQEGRAICALRKQTPEPVFAARCTCIVATSSNRCLDSASFPCAALKKARGEWSLVTMAWNLQRRFKLGYAG